MSLSRRIVLPATVALAITAAVLPAGPVHAGPGTAAVAPTRVDPGTVTDFGVQQSALTVFETHYGTGAGDRPVAYAVQMGSPGVLSVTDPVTRELLDTAYLHESSGAWGVTQASDGIVYAGSYPNAHVYSYDPRTRVTTDLGAPVAGQGLLYGLRPGTDGRIYGGTYPDAHVFSYSPTEGFRDYGAMYPGEQYVVDTAVDADRNVLWAAIGSHGHLVRLDLTTGEKRDIWPEPLRGDASYPYDINLVGGKLFVKRSQQQALVLDPDSGAVLADGFTMNSRGTSPLAPDGRSVYFTSGNGLWRYDLPTDTYGPAPDGAGAPVAGGGAGIGFGFVAGRLYATIGNYSGQALWYDLATGANERYRLPFPPQALDINNITAGPDGRVYTNLYINGNMAVLDPATGVATNVGRVGQTDGFGWHDGLMYQGVYPYGGVLEYDPARPYQLSTNPRELFRMQPDGQNRPIAFASAGSKVYVGSTPDYGLWGGALTVYDVATGIRTTHRNIIPDQAVIALAVIGDRLWAGSTIGAGGGTEPRATEAKLFTADLATGEKITEYTPVPGAFAISSVALGPDGMVWGLADGELFVLDPATGATVHRRDVPGSYTGAHDELFVNPADEHVYASLDGYLLRIDPLSKAVTVVRDAQTYRLTQDGQGNLWFRNGVKAANGAVQYGSNLLRYVPEADGCPESDLRATVLTGDVDSRVRNRYGADGCTVNDLIRDEANWGSRAAFLVHVVTVTGQLVGAKVLTPAEMGAILVAAARSGIGG
ncbi:PQQ-like beta-propeller repeat protein [Plantactinospora soyae]|uniref:Streptogramin lyase n=1 Tax=Plantactinospora soyae TaxID=1544732 RepID=A0A927R1K1_9ACTN|nr:PQQ-like beta-propeller repeat protein [Plantactinospora soyae]MBE1491477.1 streptogramin lyase [Plantactinospora soyae]